MKDSFTSLQKIKENLPHWAEFEILRNGALHVLVYLLDLFFFVQLLL